MNFAKVVEGEAKRLCRQSPAWVKGCIATSEVDFTTYRRSLYLNVRFELQQVDGAQALKASPELVTRMRAALLIKEPSAKTLKVERRLLQARASSARKLNKRPMGGK